jgi:hypothetical protein
VTFAIDPIDGSTRIERVERVRPPAQRDGRPEPEKHDREEPRERKAEEDGDTSGGGLVDVRV